MAGPPLSLLECPGRGAAGLGPPTEDSAPEQPAVSRGRVEANLLPVCFSLTLRGLKPKRPPLLGALGAGLGLGGCSVARGNVVALTPPIGGGGGGGGGAPAQ